MAFDTSNIEKFKLHLMRLAEIPDLANAEMEACAKEVQQKARDMAPIEFGDLKDAIRIRNVGTGGAKASGGKFTTGGTRNYQIYIDESHGSQHGGTVGAYAWGVHEYMGWGSTQGHTPDGKKYMPSAESVQAGAAKGVEAGGQFLARAVRALEGGIYARVQKRILQGIPIY
jgi:hypothetical protein